jgi:hypothetical protein
VHEILELRPGIARRARLEPDSVITADQLRVVGIAAENCRRDTLRKGVARPIAADVPTLHAQRVDRRLTHDGRWIRWLKVADLINLSIGLSGRRVNCGEGPR